MKEATPAYLLVNAGSSSLKVSLSSTEGEQQFVSAQVDWSGGKSTLSFKAEGIDIIESIQLSDHAAALIAILQKLRETFKERFDIKAAAHRVVHGGDHKSSALIDDQLIKELDKLSVLAPLHNPPALSAIAAARKELPAIPHLAVFDTAFHSNMLPEAQNYAVPLEWKNKYGIKRYGFHGLSHAYCTKRASEMLGKDISESRLIICHLGHGCSISAVAGGRCLDTTMGFTPLEGLMMATRSGNIDAGAVLYAQKAMNLSPDEISNVLNKQSGLLGVSGVSADMREVLAAADKGHEPSRLAVSMFCYSVQKAIAALMVPLQGKVDALVFTAGIGENSARIREMICEGLGYMGLGNKKISEINLMYNRRLSFYPQTMKLLTITTKEGLVMVKNLNKIQSSFA